MSGNIFSHEHAAKILRDNFITLAEVIHPVDGHVPSKAENEAIDYLCAEWDYGYAPFAIPGNEGDKL